MTGTVTPLGEHLGAEVQGVAAAELVTEAGAAACLDALDRHGVLVHRGLDLSDDDLVALSRLLGEVVPNPTGEHRLAEIATITLDPALTHEVLAWYRQGNFLWHVDGMTDERPQRATLLLARQVDEGDGGDTEFASTTAAYEALPADERAELDGLRVVHSFAASQRRAHADATPEQQAAWDRYPAREHPLVWQHRDGRRSLLIGATVDHVAGWPADRSDELLDRLLAWTTQPTFTLRHSWQAGDLVVFDNTTLLHRALPFEPTSPRLMHRTTLVGTEDTTPVAAA